MPQSARLRGPAHAVQPSVADLSAAGLRAFFSIAHDWTLSADEQIVLLGSPGRSTFFNGKPHRKPRGLGAIRSNDCR